MGLRIVELELEQRTIDWCRKFHGAPIQNAFTPKESFRLRMDQAETKMAECALAIYVGMDGARFVNLDKRGPFEVVTKVGLKLDVKSSDNPDARRLVWPIEKQEEWSVRQFDALVFARTHRLPIIELVGWISKTDFEAKHEESDGSIIPTVGAWFVHQDLLHDMTILVAEPEVPQYRNNHLCHCGQYGTRAVGFGPISQLQWFCGEHAP